MRWVFTRSPEESSAWKREAGHRTRLPWLIRSPSGAKVSHGFRSRIPGVTVNRSPSRDGDLRRLQLLVSGDEGVAREVTAIARGVVAQRAFGLDPAERDDLVQESVAQLWAACTRDDFELTSSLDALVRTIATARCIDHFRRRRWQVELDEQLPLDTDDPLDALHRDRTVRAVRTAIARLRPLCRDLIRWHFDEGERYEQIAVRLDRAAATLRVHMFRCLQQLRSQLGFEGDRS